MGDDVFPDMFVYEVTFSMVDFKQVNGEYNVSTWKSKVIYNSGLKSLHNFSSIIKYFGRKIGLQFNNSVLVVEQNNYATKIVNAYIVYEFGSWQRIFHKDKYLFGVTSIVKNNDKSKYVYSGYGIALIE